MDFVKRITTGFFGVAVTGLLFLGCEKSNGPEPYLCEYKYSQLVLGSGTAIPLESLDMVIIDDAG
jgi:hypothetical protein